MAYGFRTFCVEHVSFENISVEYNLRILKNTGVYNKRKEEKDKQTDRLRLRQTERDKERERVRQNGRILNEEKNKEIATYKEAKRGREGEI